MPQGKTACYAETLDPSQLVTSSGTKISLEAQIMNEFNIFAYGRMPRPYSVQLVNYSIIIALFLCKYNLSRLGPVGFEPGMLTQDTAVLTLIDDKCKK